MHPAEKLAHELHNIAHATDPYAVNKKTHVIQVWEDGEITMQKCGDLLFQRTLHQLMPPCKHYVAGLKFPYDWEGGHSFAFVGSKEEAESIRSLLEIKL